MLAVSPTMRPAAAASAEPRPPLWVEDRETPSHSHWMILPVVRARLSFRPSSRPSGDDILPATGPQRIPPPTAVILLS